MTIMGRILDRMREILGRSGKPVEEVSEASVDQSRPVERKHRAVAVGRPDGIIRPDAASARGAEASDKEQARRAEQLRAFLIGLIATIGEEDPEAVCPAAASGSFVRRKYASDAEAGGVGKAVSTIVSEV